MRDVIFTYLLHHTPEDVLFEVLQGFIKAQDSYEGAQAYPTDFAMGSLNFSVNRVSEAYVAVRRHNEELRLAAHKKSV